MNKVFSILAVAAAISGCGQTVGKAPTMTELNANVAGVFNGSNSNLYVALAGSRLAMTQGYTVEMFVRQTGTTIQNPVLFDASGGNGNLGRIRVLLDPASRITLQTRVDCVTTTTLTYPSPLGMNLDYHIAIVYDGVSTARIYVNGRATSFPVAPTPATCTFDTLSIGGVFLNGTFAEPFNGILDEVRFSSNVRYPFMSYNVPTAEFFDDPSTNAIFHFNYLDRSDSLAGSDVLNLPYYQVSWVSVDRILSSFFN